MSLLTIIVRAKVREALRAQGKGAIEALVLASSICPQMIDEAKLQLAPEHQQAMGAIGDGTLWQALLDFIKSPAGQALIQFLLSLLLAV